MTKSIIWNDWTGLMTDIMYWRDTFDYRYFYLHSYDSCLFIIICLTKSSIHPFIPLNRKLCIGVLAQRFNSHKRHSIRQEHVKWRLLPIRRGKGFLKTFSIAICPWLLYIKLADNKSKQGVMRVRPATLTKEQLKPMYPLAKLDSSAKTTF